MPFISVDSIFYFIFSRTKLQLFNENSIMFIGSCKLGKKNAANTFFLKVHSKANQFLTERVWVDEAVHNMRLECGLGLNTIFFTAFYVMHAFVMLLTFMTSNGFDASSEYVSLFMKTSNHKTNPRQGTISEQ